MGVITVTDTLEKYSESKLFVFPNLNRVRYYRNDNQLKTLNKLDQAKDWESLYPLLRKYVSNFGIINFY